MNLSPSDIKLSAQAEHKLEGYRHHVRSVVSLALGRLARDAEKGLLGREEDKLFKAISKFISAYSFRAFGVTLYYGIYDENIIVNWIDLDDPPTDDDPNPTNNIAPVHIKEGAETCFISYFSTPGMVRVDMNEEEAAPYRWVAVVQVSGRICDGAHRALALHLIGASLSLSTSTGRSWWRLENERSSENLSTFSALIALIVTNPSLLVADLEMLLEECSDIFIEAVSRRAQCGRQLVGELGALGASSATAPPRLATEFFSLGKWIDSDLPVGRSHTPVEDDSDSTIEAVSRRAQCGRQLAGELGALGASCAPNLWRSSDVHPAL
jgi:hypothetical protein